MLVAIRRMVLFSFEGGFCGGWFDQHKRHQAADCDGHQQSGDDGMKGMDPDGADRQHQREESVSPVDPTRNLAALIRELRKVKLGCEPQVQPQIGGDTDRYQHREKNKDPSIPPSHSFTRHIG